jgi:hypothetical protein
VRRDVINKRRKRRSSLSGNDFLKSLIPSPADLQKKSSARRRAYQAKLKKEIAGGKQPPPPKKKASLSSMPTVILPSPTVILPSPTVILPSPEPKPVIKTEKGGFNKEEEPDEEEDPGMPHLRHITFDQFHAAYKEIEKESKLRQNDSTFSLLRRYDEAAKKAIEICKQEGISFDDSVALLIALGKANWQKFDVEAIWPRMYIVNVGFRNLSQNEQIVFETALDQAYEKWSKTLLSAAVYNPISFVEPAAIQKWVLNMANRINANFDETIVLRHQVRTSKDAELKRKFSDVISWDRSDEKIPNTNHYDNSIEAAKAFFFAEVNQVAKDWQGVSSYAAGPWSYVKTKLEAELLRNIENMNYWSFEKSVRAAQSNGGALLKAESL